MKKQEQKNIIDLDKFDSEVSLYQLIPSGKGMGQKRLKIIVDSIYNSQVEQSNIPFNMLITGQQATRLHARSFLRAIGMNCPIELPAQLLQSTCNEVFNFFSLNRMCDSYIISSLSLLHPSILKTPYEIITNGEISKYDNIKKMSENIPVFRPLIMCSHTKNDIPNYFLEQVKHVVELEQYTEQQLELIVLQRLKYANIEYAEEKVLKMLVDYGCKKLNLIIRILKDSIIVMLSDGRNALTVDDIQKVMSYS